MNKIIYLEPDEEIISVIDRLKKIEEEKIALVIPAGALLFSSAVNLKLLKEESEKIGKEISVVSGDRAGRNIASQIGFTVYENLNEAREIKEKDDEEREKKTPDEKVNQHLEEKEEVIDEKEGYTDIERESSKLKTQSSNQIQIPKSKIQDKDGFLKKKKRGLGYVFTPKFLISGILSAVTILFLLVFIFPKATVYIDVYASEEEVEIPFALSLDKKSDEDKEIIAAFWEDKEKEITIKAQATGEKNIGDKASGTVTLYNRSGKTQLLSAGTEFEAKDGKIFVNPEDLTVPGALVSDFGELVPGKSSGKLEAKEGGASYNISSTRFNIPSLGSMSVLIYGISEESFSGGTDKQAKVVTKEDIESGYEKAKEATEEELEKDFGIKGDKIFVKGLAVSEVVDEKADKKEDDQAEEFNVSVKAKFSFLVFNKNDFNKLFEDKINLYISDQKMMVGKGYRSVEWDVLEFDADKKEAKVLGRAVILLSTKIDEDFLKSKITGLNVAELRAVLANYSEVELTRVKFFPPLLLGSIPANERNVTIKIHYIEQSISVKEWEFYAG